MSRHEQGLVQRRQELLARSEAQRAALIGIAAPLLRKAEALDRVVASVRRYPIVTGVVAAAVALFGSRRLIDLGVRAFTLYTLFRR